MTKSRYDWANAVQDTDRFYEEQDSRSYSDEQVNRWLSKWFYPFAALNGKERILDLCCGDGVWSLGLLRSFPEITVVGVDVSSGATNKANERATRLGLTDRATFFSYDCESSLPLQPSSFDLVFARGVFLFNQHDMVRPGCIKLLRDWHSLLVPGGRFVAMYGSKLDRLGSYTPAEETKGLPTNLCSRETPSINFLGGKFNHSPATFLRPFLELDNSLFVFYQFKNGRHILVTEALA